MALTIARRLRPARWCTRNVPRSLAKPQARAHIPLMPEKRYTKSNLPEKICAACGRPFAWRKKWARDWDNVKTCSERCKGDLRARNRSA